MVIRIASKGPPLRGPSSWEEQKRRRRERTVPVLEFFSEEYLKRGRGDFGREKEKKIESMRFRRGAAKTSPSIPKK